MKKISILVLTASLLACLVPSTQAAKPAKAAKAAAGAKGAKKAQKAVLEKYDKNGNGSIDADEVEAIKKAFDTDPSLKAPDKNGDGKLDDTEVSAINPAAKKKKK